MRVGLPLLQPGLSGERDWIAGFYYVRNCLHALAALPPDEVPEIVAFVPDQAREPLLFPEYAGRTPWLKVVPVTDGASVGPARWEDQLDSEACDVVFPLTDIPTAAFSLPAIAWLPDFQHKHLRHLFGDSEHRIRELVYNFLIACCERVVCNSQAVRDDLKTYYPALAGKGTVVSFSATLPSASLQDAPGPRLAELGITGTYVYLPNQFWVHKNHALVFEAWRLLKSRGINCLLVCTGHSEDYRFPKHFEQLQGFLATHGLNDVVRLLGFVGRDQQIQLYRGATVVLQPSLFEGWSTSIEEARALGKSLVVSDIPVHREQCADRATFFPKDDAAALADLISGLCDQSAAGYDEDTERSALAAARVRAAVFGRQLVDLFDQAVQIGNRDDNGRSTRQLAVPLVIDLRRELASSEADRKARLSVISRLEDELTAIEADRSARLDVIDRLKQQLTASEADRTARLEVIDRLHQQLTASEADRAARLEVIDRLQRELEASEADRAARLDVITALEKEEAVVAGQLADKAEEARRLAMQLAAYESVAWGAVKFWIHARDTLARRRRRS